MTRPGYRRSLILGLFLLCACLAWPAIAHGPGGDQPASTPPPEVPEQWGCPMCETVRQDTSGVCPICRMDLVPMEAAPGPAEAMTAATVASTGPQRVVVVEVSRPLMPGVPRWMFIATAVTILMISFVSFEVWGRRRPPGSSKGKRWDLLRLPGARWLFRKRWFQPVLQFPVFLLFTMILFAGFFGNQDPSRNIAPTLTWTLWWTWLTLVILFLGKVWCTMCPWMAIADWIAKIGTLRKSGRPFGLERRWPKALRNIWLATVLFVGLTWLELGYGVTHKPWLTAALGLAMVGVAVGTVLVFERKAFCRYACLVGRVSGLYSMFAGSELRARDREICAGCESRDCFNGNERADACPTHQFMGAMTDNTYCTLCLQCVRSCPEDNVSWFARPLGSDLLESTRTRVDEAYLAVVMLSMSAFHGLTMTPAWDRIVDAAASWTGGNHLTAFSLSMAAMILAPLVVYYGVCRAMRWLADDRVNSTRLLFIRFSYSLLPIALFYHLAHNLQHIFYEGSKVVRAASDPFGWGWNLFGTADMAINAVLRADIGWYIQISLIVVGHVFGLLVAHRAAVALYSHTRRATLSQIPMLVAMLLFSTQSLWLLAQPMAMRTAM